MKGIRHRGGDSVLSSYYSSPTYPRASTLENAVVGVGGAPRPMNDRVRPPCERKVDTRGVERLGKATGVAILEVSVIVDGVRVVSVGEGGNTKSV